MAAGHFTGFGRSLLEEDAVVQSSMGPIVDRSQEHLSSSDVAVAQTRQMLLEALAGADAESCPLEAHWPTRSRDCPTPLEVIVADGERWEEAALVQTSA